MNISTHITAHSILLQKSLAIHLVGWDTVTRAQTWYFLATCMINYELGITRYICELNGVIMQGCEHIAQNSMTTSQGLATTWQSYVHTKASRSTCMSFVHIAYTASCFL